jgi:hypothetical protein
MAHKRVEAHPVVIYHLEGCQNDTLWHVLV